MELNNPIIIIFLLFFIITFIIKIILEMINYMHRKKNGNNIPKEIEDIVDQNKVEKINQYSNAKLFFSLIESVLDKIILFIILLFAIIPYYSHILLSFTSNKYLFCILFYFSFLLLNMIISIPFSLYFNFKIEKKYNFNKMSPGIWVSDFIKQLIVSLVLTILLIVPLLFIVETFPDSWWYLLWIFFVVFMLFIQLIYPGVIAPLFNKFKPLDNKELKEKIDLLLQKSGFQSKGVFEMDASKRSTHSNAYFTGFGKSKRIVLFDNLLKNHNDDEILAILAHELGHFKHKHIIKNLLSSLLMVLLGLYIAFLFVNSDYLYQAFLLNSDNIDLKLKFLGLFLVTVIGEPFIYFLTPIHSVISRKYEYQADLYSVQVIKQKKPLINALKKLSIDNLNNLFPSKIYTWFYYSHPPLFKRIAKINKIEIN